MCHRCDFPVCVNPAHVYAGTQIDNMADCLSRGRFNYQPRAVGEQHGRSKLTNADVSLIRELYGGRRPAVGKLSGPQLARRFGVSHVLVYKIIRRKLWATRTS